MPTTCGRCHRGLKTLESIQRGFGPKCWKAVQDDHAEYKKPFKDGAAASDYDYRIDRGAEPVLVITDLNRGGLSVTNNIRAILDQITWDEGVLDIKFLTELIIYRDSDGNYDGIAVDNTGRVTFYSLVIGNSVTNEQEALQAARQRRLTA